MSVFAIPAAVLAHAGRLAAALPVDVDIPELLTGRAALLGLPQPGQVSAGGASRLLRARDAWCALTLSRPDDVAAVPALLEGDDVGTDPWPAIADWLTNRDADTAVARARLLGMPAAVLAETSPAQPDGTPLGPPAAPRTWADLLVVELASMWAGPLCGRMLAGAGATVVKVESPTRPDGTRGGSPEFFDWVNSGKHCVTLDFDNPGELRALLAAADVVIEGSRPAALARRGLGPDTIPARDGRVWVRITGYGTTGERAEWVAFGDDAAVAGGLVGGTGDAPHFLGDAIADPLTGLTAAHAVFEALRRGGGELLAVSMAGVAASYAALPDEGTVDVTPHRPAPRAPASGLGADNAAVRRLLESRSAPC
ncbi:CoA transferase [Mycolicibacterium litorale]|uniref:CoA transferase n=1 Tax=Mycolicibacterium litorale TaxID=758802 RepID=UPI001066EF83|nr:CoA transferase [Mycolicibacterium litorale]MCV7417173.1 CoA transferase [Mycolicibacterium litorale]TDY04961.1 CoA transferase family III [Mycolicibacterium litorale]